MSHFPPFYDDFSLASETLTLNEGADAGFLVTAPAQEVFLKAFISSIC